jgi:hypothetical protein
MLQAVRQHAVVQPDGRIVIHVPELKPGTHAEVTIVEEAESGLNGPGGTVSLPSLVGSCCGMFATPEEADAFLARERDAWDS